jgi:hypothetical protein
MVSVLLLYSFHPDHLSYGQAQGLMPIILATQEMEIGRMVFQRPAWVKISLDPISTNIR